jgi:hypothetical protein
MIAACAVFDPPLAGTDASVGPGGASGNQGSGGAAGTSSGRGGDSGRGGSAGAGGSGAVSGSAGISGSGGSGPDGGDGSADSGGSGGNLPLGPWWKKKSADGCDVEALPSAADRPNVPDGPSISAITLAQWRLRIGAVLDDPPLTDDRNAWLDIGFDLDRSCTLSPTCNVGDAGVSELSCKNDLYVPKDGNRCRDNALGSLFGVGAASPIVGGLFRVHEQNWNCAMHRGETTTLFRITNYNGQPYDPAVRLDIYSSVGTRSLPLWKCLNPDETINPTWKSQAPWLSNKHWYVSRRSIALNAPDVSPALPNARAADPAAFVRGGYLYASLPPNAEMWLQGDRAHVAGLRTVLQRAFLVGRLHRTSDGWFLDDATVAGTVLPDDEMRSFREIGFCENMCGSYNTLQDYFNAASDVLSSTSEKLPNEACDALSIGFSIAARSATADASDLVDTLPPVECPPPRHPGAPQHGCVCQPDGTCTTDGGAGTGGTGGAGGSGGS